MRRLTLYAVFAAVLTLLAACGDRAAEADRLWASSVAALNQGNFHAGFDEAKHLRWYDSDRSAYLLGQFMVYGAGSHELNFTMGLEPFYKNVLAIDLKPSNPYVNQIVTAKLFALRFLEGPMRALVDSKQVCAVVRKDDVRSCIAHFMRDAEERYLVDPSRFNALYLYQSARLGQDLDAANTDEAIFLSGLALFKIDDRRARLSIDILNRRKAITGKMWDRFCQLAQKLELDDRKEVCSAASYAHTPKF